MQLAVIFDMDGVLVESKQAHYESWQRIGQEQGFALTMDQFRDSFGRTNRDAIVDWFGSDLPEESITDLDRRKEAAYREIFRKKPTLVDGAAELIDALHAAGFALAVGSSGPIENVNMVLDLLKKRECFGGIASGSDITRGKPDPEVFLLAAAKLKMEPAYCLVIEDAPVGVAAAQAADMKCIALVGTVSPQQLSAADLVVHSLREVTPKIVQELLKG